MLFDYFDLIRIVNLKHRKDRRREMEAELGKVGLLGDPRVSFFEAITTPDSGPFRRTGSHGAFLSHLALLKEARGQSILILQDDCDFLLPDILDYKLPDCDVFYGGYSASDPQKPHDSDIIGAHFMGFSGRAASAAVDYLERYTRDDFEPDPRASKEPGYDSTIRPPIDGALVWFRRAHPEYKTVFASLGFQRPSKTDIGDQKWFDRLPLVRDVAKWARKTLRRRPDAGGRSVFR